MNKWEIEVQKSLLDSEESVLKELENQYKRTLKDITEKVKAFQADIDLLDAAMNQEGIDDATKQLLQSQKRSKIYQKNYQDALKRQVGSILDKMQSDQFTSIDGYLKECYKDSYVGTLYDLVQQGIPVITPINQASVVKAVLTDSKISNGLYESIGVSTSKLKKTISQEISRGIASGLPYRDIARNISNVSGSGYSNAKRIVITEGNRIQNTASRDAALDAKAHGSDLVKIWDATLDGKTRPSHRRVDGEIRELDEKFSNGLDLPGDTSAPASEVVNCRCKLEHKPRWDAEGGFAKIDNFTGEVMTFNSQKDYADFKEKYWSKENLDYMQHVSAMEQKYGTKKFDKILDSMSDAEYQKLKKLEEENPMFKSYSSNEKSKVQYKSTVASDFVKNPEYRKLYNMVDDSPEVQRIACKQARTMIEHRAGTKFEDLTYINTETGKHMTRTDYDVEGQVIPNKPMRDMVMNAKPYTIVSVHNHPGSAVPSMADIDSAYEKKYKYGIIACHNGNVFKYQVTGEYDKLYVDMLLDKLHIALYNDGGKNNEALQQAIEELKSNNVVLEVITHDI